jgi:predicted ATPase
LARGAAAGVQVIIETHSDHVLNGIRRAVRGGVMTSEEVSLLFFSNSSGGAQVSKLQINPSGGIDPWPEGFFDQMEKDLMELF